MIFKAKRSGFSLVELMISAVVVLIVAAAGLMSIVVINRSSRMALDRTRAESLLERSRADVGRMAASFFDRLQDCQFPDSLSGEQSDCGMEDLVTDEPEYAGFSRRMDVVVDNEELKTVILEVTWLDRGAVRNAETIFKVARPSEALSGNIIGCVRDINTKEPIGAASITASPAGGSSGVPIQTLSSGEPFFDNLNFSFEDEVTGSFALNTGIWSLGAKHENYLDLVYADADGHPEAIAVTSGKTVTLPECLEMEPQPGPSFLRVRLLYDYNRDPTNPDWDLTSLYNVNAGLYVRYTLTDEWGNKTHKELYGKKTFKDPVDELIEVPVELISEAGGELCMTVYTLNTFGYRRAGLISDGTCREGLTRERDGWSSARAGYGCALDNGDRVDWNGDNVPERTICISYNEERQVDIKLEHIPLIHVEGRISVAGAPPFVSGYYATTLNTHVGTASKIYEVSTWGQERLACYYSSASGKTACRAQDGDGNSLSIGSSTSNVSNRYFHSCDQQYDANKRGDVCKWMDSASSGGMNYRFEAPDMPAMFYDNEYPSDSGPSNWYLHACGQVERPGCCETSEVEYVCSDEVIYTTAQLRGKDRIEHDFVLSASSFDFDCFDAIGDVKLLPGNVAVDAGTEVIIKGVAGPTDASGEYAHVCHEPGADGLIRRTGDYEVLVEQVVPAGYHWLNVTNQDTIYRGFRQPDAEPGETAQTETVFLFPERFGRVVFTVRDVNTDSAISGANVSLRTFNLKTRSCTTDSSGRCTLSSIQETWPPLDLATFDMGISAGTTAVTTTSSCDGGSHGNRSYFCYKTRNHTATVSHSLYETLTPTVSSVRNGETRYVTVKLTPKPQDGGDDDGGGGGM